MHKHFTIYTGLFYIFIGFITINTDGDVTSAHNSQNIVGMVMMMVGAVYFCLGTCMVQVIERSRVEILRVREAYTLVVNDNDTEAAV